MESNEKYIIKNLKNHSEEIDLDGLWDEVSPHIPKEKKHRRLGFWIFGSVLIGLLSMSLYWVSNVQSNDNELSHSVAASSNDELAEKDLHKELTISNKTERDYKTARNNESISNASKQFNTTIESNTTVLQSKESIDIKNGLTPTSSENKISTLKQSSSKTKLNKNQPDLPILEYTVSTNVTKNEIEPKKDHVKTNISLLENEGRYNAKLNIPFLTNRNQLILKHERDLVNRNFIVGINIQKHSDLIFNRWSFYLQGGEAIVNRKLSTRDIEFRPEVNRRNSIVDVLGAWQIGGGFEFRLRPKLRISLGLNYLQIHEKATFETDYLVDVDVEKDNTIYYQDGSVQNNISSGTNQGTRHTEEIRYNQLKMLQVPVKISYQVFTFNRSKIYLGASAAYTLRQNYRGFTSLSPSQERYDLELDLDDKFRSSGSMSYGVFVEGSTHLTSVVDLSFGLGYNKTIKINSEIYLIDQQYNSLSFSSGLHYRF